jgi:hypothetical protein
MGKAFNKQIAPVIDIFPDLCGVAYTRKAIQNKMDMLASLGFSRVYLVVPPPGYPMFSNPWMDLIRPENTTGNHAVESLLGMGDPTFEHVFAAKRVGLDVYAIIKPYEGGGGYTEPKGRKTFLHNRSIPCLGGERMSFDAFLRENPDKRVKRKPIANYDTLMAQDIQAMTLSFCLDRVEEQISNKNSTVFNAKSDGSILDYPLKALRLWGSQDNGSYEPLGGDFLISEKLVEKILVDANGVPLFANPVRCREVEITGLRIPADLPYLAVTFDLEQGQRVMIPFSMIKAYGENGEVPITCTPYVRTPAKDVDLDQGSGRPADPAWFTAAYPQRYDDSREFIERFQKYGFEYEWHGAGFWGNGWMDHPGYGIARGKMAYMKGTHCEAYPEVRAYWLDQVSKLVAMGLDGVDIRLQNHSGMVSDYVNYGYNEPIVAAYYKKHGVDIMQEEADPIEIMRIRGDFYGDFVEAAAQVLHQNGKKLQCHLRHSLAKPRLSSAFGELGFWAMPKVLPDWQRIMALADEITLKDYNHGHYNADQSSEIKDAAKAMQKPLWIHCYLHQGNDLNEPFLKAVQEDERVTGMLLYELGHNPYVNNYWNGLLEVKPGGEVVFNEAVRKQFKSMLDI